VKGILLVVEARSKVSFLKSPYKELSPEEGVFNRYLFWWINSLLIAGYERLLLYKDLPKLDDEMSSERLRDQMNIARGENCKSLSIITFPQYPTVDFLLVKLSLKRPLLFAAARCLRYPLILVILPRACLVVLRFAQPSLFSSAISYVNEHDIESHGERMGYQGYGLISSAALIYTGIAVWTLGFKVKITSHKV
jgi:ATP-binding cassette subfamily C (CFTR/MRP) protein 1